MSLEQPEDEGTRKALRRAVPLDVSSIGDGAISFLLAASARLAHAVSDRSRVGPQRVQGEDLFIPYRIYSPAFGPSGLPEVDPELRAAQFCAYTRHQDGFGRENALREIVRLERSWIVP